MAGGLQPPERDEIWKDLQYNFNNWFWKRSCTSKDYPWVYMPSTIALFQLRGEFHILLTASWCLDSGTKMSEDMWKFMHMSSFSLVAFCLGLLVCCICLLLFFFVLFFCSRRIGTIIHIHRGSLLSQIFKRYCQLHKLKVPFRKCKKISMQHMPQSLPGSPIA